jgi:superfamily II DNA/RNA helicase
MSTQSFAELGVSKPVRDALERRGIVEPFAVQRLVIADAIAGRDVLAKSPTGSGKTLAFGIPIVERLDAGAPRPAALVLAPTRELASQITDDRSAIAHARGLRIAAVYGGVGISKQAALAARAHIVVATPGRLEDLLSRGSIKLDAVSMLVLDEADRMLDMGFRPAVERIIARAPRARQTLFFSATLDGLAGQLARRHTTNALLCDHSPATGADSLDLEHRFVAVDDAGRVEALVAELEGERELALVFVRTKRGADRLVKRLDGHGVAAAAIHANKSQRQREQALESFESGHIDTLVATDIAARGIDIDGVSHVINFDPPGDHASYLHRVGRTARAGRSGVGITLVGASQRQDVRLLARELGIATGLGGGHSETPAASRGNGSGTRRSRPSRRRRRSPRREPA